VPSGVAASILDYDFARLGEEVRAVERHVDRFQIDVMDGDFVPNLSFGFPILRALRSLTRKPLEAHLMSANPDRYAGEYAEAGADYVIVHVEANRNLPRMFAETLAESNR
jgi:ribulose-phosphate 3-epimerase